jgi:NAD(P)-dependent dehydrogenase (short-subunit alcohol dehydrogenase family)
MTGRGAAIVTGGAGGIGRAVSARLTREGFSVAAWDLSRDAADCALALSVDVTDAAAVAEAARRTRAELGPIRALVVNAGIIGPTLRLWETPPAEFRRVIEVNLVSAYLTCHAVLPHMLENPGPDRGRVVLVGSVVGKEGSALAGAYAASKAGVMTLAKVLGKELAAEGILVNAIAPTVVRTAMSDRLDAGQAADKLGRIPMGRFAEAAEVAAMVAFLCGPDCTFSTGAVFDLSGGRLMDG